MVVDCKACPDVTPSLSTTRLRLDRPELADAGDIITLADNRKVAEMLSRMPNPYGLDDARAWIASAGNSGKHGVTLAVRLLTTGRLIGACGIDRRETNAPLQLGYWIGEPHWGSGYATEASHALIDHVFAAIRRHRDHRLLPADQSGLAPGAGEMRLPVSRPRHDPVQGTGRRCSG